MVRERCGEGERERWSFLASGIDIPLDIFHSFLKSKKIRLLDSHLPRHPVADLSSVRSDLRMKPMDKLMKSEWTPG